MKRALTGAAAAVVLVAVGACGGYEGPWEGTVVGKEYHSPYTIYVPMSCGQGCSIPVPFDYPERYEVCLNNSDLEPDYQYGCRDVAPSDYDELEFGDWFEFPDQPRPEGA